MSGYAPNPTSSSENENDGYAPLTAGLLARKGEAMPAVDADAHAGVDIDMQPSKPAGGPPQGVNQDTIESLYPPNPTSGGRARSGSAGAPHAPAHQARPNGSPDLWTIMPPRKSRPFMRSRPPRPTEAGDHQRKATVTFRMPAKDFVRLRFASRDMEMSCQSIILEALDCYLDANDVQPVPDEICESELDRLMRAGKTRRAERRQDTGE